MKHAYLILAHNDIPLLQVLVNCLDDSRNDIYIHWDVKSGNNPSLKVVNSNLFFLKERIDVRWAGYSMVEAEYLLFKKAFNNGPYAYYHLLSGSDLPIKPQNTIHHVCSIMEGTEFIGFAETLQAEIDYRVQHYFLFSEDFRTNNIFKRGLRFLYLKYQDIMHKKRKAITVKKGAQWCSLTQSFVEYLLGHESVVRELFRHSFCPDEMFVQTICYNSPFWKNVNNASSEYNSNMRYIKWKEGELLAIEESDLPELKTSDKWFARKFSSSDSKLIEKVVQLSR